MDTLETVLLVFSFLVVLKSDKRFIEALRSISDWLIDQSKRKGKIHGYHIHNFRIIGRNGLAYTI
ncbi:hypothetical protein J2W98_000082 [Paenibacillus peoriae]|jgi:hypothetical protein|uniref:Transposase n=1 Tax=Paenibacillus peoriae TaxID=59893 RepID=A0ABU1QAH0_9BACL|nr:hypothetical protein [Paenibacillus peoriae]